MSQKNTEKEPAGNTIQMPYLQNSYDKNKNVEDILKSYVIPDGIKF